MDLARTTELEHLEVLSTEFLPVGEGPMDLEETATIFLDREASMEAADKAHHLVEDAANATSVTMVKDLASEDVPLLLTIKRA